MLNMNVIDIKQIVDPAKFQSIQDDISVATELAIITVDYRGVPITAHSNCCDFCKLMRSSDVYRNYCEKCDSRGGLEAARIQKPFIYFCHAGLIDLAIPIIVNNLYLGAFMAGQVLLDKKDDTNKLEHIFSGVDEIIDFSNDKILSEYYAELPTMYLERIEALAKMLQHIGNYCVEDAVLRASTHQRPKNNADGLLKTSAEYFESKHNSRSYPAEFRDKTSNRVLQPAIEYIKQHPHEKITLSKMAALCNISTSYFSKLFAKENLGNLSNYVNHNKVVQAKELLQKTDWSVRYIADKIGFDDCSYFIKVFKNCTGVTPEEFRKGTSEL